MARRAFIHLGTAKSGTTYLQGLWWRHRDALAAQGLLLPGAGVRDHFHAAALVKGMDAIVDSLSPEERQTWQRLLAATEACAADVLISHEHFSDSPPQAAATALADLASVADEVHVVVTVRDLARVLPSAWQQRVKQGARQTFARFLGTAREQQGDATFWRYQDVPAILDRWGAGLPEDRIHLVVVPPSGAPRDELWQRVARVLGVDVSALDAAPLRPNESLSLVETELLRQVNAAIPRARRSIPLTRLTKGTFSREILAGTSPREPIVLPAEHTDWVVDRATSMVAELSARSHDVVGDLRDLLPGPPPGGRLPEDVTQGELLAAARQVLIRMTEPLPYDDLEDADALRQAVGAIAGRLQSDAQRLGQRGTNAQ